MIVEKFLLPNTSQKHIESDARLYKYYIKSLLFYRYDYKNAISFEFEALESMSGK